MAQMRFWRRLTKLFTTRNWTETCRDVGIYTHTAVADTRNQHTVPSEEMLQITQNGVPSRSRREVCDRTGEHATHYH